MMYGTGSDPQMRGISSKECKRDLELEAKRLKKRIVIFSLLRDAIGQFFKEGHMHWLDEREHRTAFLLAFGALTLEIPALEKEYEFILAEIEKEK